MIFFHVKDTTVNILWIWMIIFKIIFTNVLLFKHVWVSECESREVDCILYGMFNVQKKKRERKKLKSPLFPLRFAFLCCPALCDCHLQSCTVQLNAISVPPLLQCQSDDKRRHRLLNSGLRFCHSKRRNPKLWSTQKHTVTDVVRLSTFSPLSSRKFDLF